MGWTSNTIKNQLGLKQNLCWSCDNAAGGCSWSRRFIPVKGWTADKDQVMHSTGSNDNRKRYSMATFKIYSCPKFIPLKGGKHK